MILTNVISKAGWDEMERPKNRNNVSSKPIPQCSDVDWVLGFDGAFGIGFSVDDIDKPKVNRNYKKIKFIESKIIQGHTYFCFMCDDDSLTELFACYGVDQQFL